MKTIVNKVKRTAKAAILCMFTMLTAAASAQSVSGANGLAFKNPALVSGTNLLTGATYRFSNVTTNVYALVRIDSLVNGAEVRQIDDNSGGLGYLDAFQPEIRIPQGAGEKYAVFTISFYNAVTNNIQFLDSIRATAVDIDGNLQLKELVEINMNGGSASFMGSALDILVSQLSATKFRAENILGIERSGIDTSGWGNMITVKKPSVSSFTIKYGARTIGAANGTRQYSLYMKGFTYPNQITLPVKLESFTAILNNNSNKVDLRWVTSYEKNVSHFVVEKSTDGKNYADAGVVFAYGNSSDIMNYILTDQVSKQENIIYYRLRSVDADGKFDYSATRIIRTAKQTENTVSILTYPNPVTSELRITIPNSWQGKKVTYELLNANAQVTKKAEAGSGSQTETMNVSNVAPGLYIVKVSCGAETATQKIIKR
ncbi:MAG: T9SS type A sorting domain-containing protein [Chitinophagaceae bacterium]|nr:T9SS type A sorting domain-containing protein [Chitinophagaceae bacterium]